MARHNPFRIFRKNQTAWLAGLTLFTMFSFIALGSMFQCLQVGSRTAQGGVFAKTKTLGNYDYAAMLMQQDEVNRLYTFLQTAASAMAEDQLLATQGNLIFTFEGPADKPEERMPVILDQLMLLLGELSNTLNGENSENLVNRWLIVQSGRKEGLAPTENNVRDYLTSLFNGKLNSRHLAQGLASAGLRQDGLVLLLQNQLVYDWMIRRADGGWRNDPITAMTAMPTGHGTLAAVPGEEAAVGERLYRTLKAEVAAFPVENYFDQIPDPTKEEARAYFEMYKNVPWSATSDRPGFFMPTKTSFEVVSAELTDELLDAVTDEEIAAYYEEHLEDFARPAANAAPSASPAPGIEGADEFALPEDLEPTDVAAPAEEAPADAAPAEEAPAEAPAEGGETSSLADGSVYRLVAYEEGNAEAAEAPAEVPAADAPADVPAEAAAGEAPAEESPAAESASETPAEAEAPAEETVAEETPAEKAPAEETADGELTLDETPAEESAYYPLDEVKEGIRRQIATDKLIKQLEEIQTQMEEYARRLANKRANVSTGNIELVEVNLPELAEAKGFVYYQTSIADEEGNPVPALLDLNEAASARALPIQVLYEIYNSSVMDYSPQITPVFDNKVHLYWVTESKSEHTPEYDEVEGLVVATWKKEKAIGLAEKDAAALKARAESEGKTLEQLAQDDGEAAKYTFVKTEPFTQYELPRSFRSPSLSLSEVREEGVAEGESFIDNKALTAVGDSFFDAVYALPDSGIGVCFNAPKDRALAVQIIERADDASVLEKMGEGGGIDPNAVQTMRLIQNLKFQDDWLEQLKADAGFQWVTVPGRVR